MPKNTNIPANPSPDGTDTSAKNAPPPSVMQTTPRGPQSADHHGGGPAPRREWKGGPAGANQGGASRGSSRLEPSHVHDAARKDHAKKPAKGDKH